MVGIEDMIPNPDKPVLDRYKILSVMGVTVYSDTTLRKQVYSRERLEELSKDNEMVRNHTFPEFRGSFMSVFDDSKYSVCARESYFFSGGGFEKIVGLVPCSEENHFYDQFKNVMEKLRIPILKKEISDKGIWGDVHFLYPGPNWNEIIISNNHSVYLSDGSSEGLDWTELLKNYGFDDQIELPDLELDIPKDKTPILFNFFILPSQRYLQQEAVQEAIRKQGLEERISSK